MVLKEQLDTLDDIDARLVVIEGFLDLGLPADALEHLDRFSAEEQALPKARELREMAKTRL